MIFYALDPVQGRGKELARTRLAQPADLNWKVSPEGLRIAVFRGDQPRGQVRIVDLQNGTERNLQLPHGWAIWSLRWAADGNALFAAAQSTEYLIVRIDLDGKSTRTPQSRQESVAWFSLPVTRRSSLGICSADIRKQCLAAGELLTPHVGSQRRPAMSMTQFLAL